MNMILHTSSGLLTYSLSLFHPPQAPRPTSNQVNCTFSSSLLATDVKLKGAASAAEAMARRTAKELRIMEWLMLERKVSEK